jgi:hypothetical protein
MYFAAPVLAFVLLYSILPHKELRFIFPAIPIFTLVAAVGLNELLPSGQVKRLWYPLNLLDSASSDQKDVVIKVQKKNDDEGRLEEETKAILSGNPVYNHLLRLAFRRISEKWTLFGAVLFRYEVSWF